LAKFCQEKKTAVQQTGRHAEVAGWIPIKWGFVHPKKQHFQKKKHPPPQFPNVNIFYVLSLDVIHFDDFLIGKFSNVTMYKLRASPAVLTMRYCTVKLDEETSKVAGFGSARLHTVCAVAGKRRSKVVHLQKRV
jgi:hypothetical protein